MINKLINILLFLPLFVNAQLTNDWINYDQNYFKFPIAEDGVYRIDFQQLINAGMNIGGIDPRNFQIFASFQWFVDSAIISQKSRALQ